MGSSKSFFCSLIFFLCILNLSIHSVAYVSINNITLLGDANFQEQGKIFLTSSSSSSIGVGGAFYSHPIRFLDPSTNSHASFIASFSFYIIPDSSSSPQLFGDGLTFLITSNPYAVVNGFGYMGLSNQTSQEDGMYIAVEFDTSFDPNLEDISDNHIGIDINSVMSFASVDSTSVGFDLKNGKRTTVQVKYIDSKKTMEVWVSSHTVSRPIRPILAFHIDLSMYLEEFMFVGFCASNGKGGSAQYVVEKWRFRTYGFLPSTNSFDTTIEGGCFMCVPDDIVLADTVKLPSKKTRELAHGFGGAAFLVSVLVVLWRTGYFFKGNKTVGDTDEVIDEHKSAQLEPLLKRASPDEVTLPTRNRGRTAYLYRDRKKKSHRLVEHASVVVGQPTGSNAETEEDLQNSVARCAEAANDAKNDLNKCRTRINAISAILKFRGIEKDMEGNSNEYDLAMESLEPRNLRKCDERNHPSNKIEDFQRHTDSQQAKIKKAKQEAGKSDPKDELFEKSDEELKSLKNEEKHNENKLVTQRQNRLSELQEAKSKRDRFVNL